jgi:CelD/BcsL family acetyltransferase involved in cellulose biosynthesis
MSIEIWKGSAAIAHLKQDKVLREWQELYDRCAWATSAQRPEFIRLRYEIYETVANPVLIEQHERECLVGLLALALPNHSSWALGAACEDSEYNVWLCDVEYIDKFMPDALTALWKKMRTPPLHLYYIPAEASIEWARRGKWRRRSVIESKEVWRLRLGSIDQSRQFVHSKKSLKSLSHQIQRIGKLSFRKIDGQSEFIPTLDKFIEIYSSRKKKKTGKTIFEIDPFKRAYLLARQAMPGMQHTTVLELDGRAIAAHIGIAGRPNGMFSLAGIAHDDEYARYSPGSLLLAELIPLLAEEGYSTFDLTPGGDEYKKRWGDSTSIVYDMELFPSFPQKAYTIVMKRLAAYWNRLKTCFSQMFTHLRRECSPGEGHSPKII